VTVWDLCVFVLVCCVTTRVLWYVCVNLCVVRHLVVFVFLCLFVCCVAAAGLYMIVFFVCFMTEGLLCVYLLCVCWSDCSCL
jgi:hypothetical protein